MIDSFFRDVSFAIRVLLRQRTRTLAAVVTLALALGVTATIVSLVDGLLFRSLPNMIEPRRTMWLFETTGDVDANEDSIAPGNYLDWKQQVKTADLGAFRPAAKTLIDQGDAERLSAMAVTEGFADLIGTRLALGRQITAEDVAPGAPAVAVIGDDLWRRRFGSDANVVGKSIALDGVKHTIVGVMPQGLQFPAPIDLWVPLSFSPEERNDRTTQNLVGVARLHQGVAEETFTQELADAARVVEQEHPETNAKKGAGAMNVVSLLLGPARPVSLVLLIGATLVLAMACVNVGNLILAGAAGRQREIATRVALGATRVDLIRQLLIESLVLAVAGGALGLLVSLWSVDALMANISTEMKTRIYGLSSVAVDGRIVAMMVGVTLLTTLGFGLIPALRTSQVSVAASIRDGGGGALGRKSQRRSARVLMGAQVALAVVLVTGATLAIRNHMIARARPLGFDASQSLIFSLERPGKGEDQERVLFFKEIANQVAAVPGVTGVTLTSNAPLSRGYEAAKLQIPGTITIDADIPWAKRVIVDTNYFSVMGIELKQGRVFTSADDGRNAVVVLSERAAVRVLGDTQVIGKQLMLNKKTLVTVVGVVSDVLDPHNQTNGTVYIPYVQFAVPAMTIVARTSVEPRSLQTAVKASVRNVSATIPVERFRTLNEQIENLRWGDRLLGGLLTALATLSLVLATVGVYGVVGQSAQERSPELGVRAALGASTQSLIATVIADAAVAAVPGLVVGLALTPLLAVALNKASMSDGSTPIWVVLAVATTLGLSALLASLGPALRAALRAPMNSLRRAT